MTYLVKLSPIEFAPPDGLPCLRVAVEGVLSTSPFHLKPFKSFSEAALVAELYQKTLDATALVGDKELKEGAVSEASVCLHPHRVKHLGHKVVENEWDKRLSHQLKPVLEEQRWSSDIPADRIKNSL